MLPKLLEDNHKRGQEIAGLIAGVIAVQYVFQANFDRNQAAAGSAYDALVAKLQEAHDRYDACIFCNVDHNTPVCKVFNDIAKLDELDLITYDLFAVRQLSKPLNLTLTQNALEAQWKIFRTMILKTENDLPTTNVKGKRGYLKSIVTDETFQKAFDENDDYRMALEQQFVLEFVSYSFRYVKLSDAQHFWRSFGGLTDILDSKVRPDIRRSFVEVFPAFFFSISFAVSLVRIALKAPELNLSDVPFERGRQISTNE